MQKIEYDNDDFELQAIVRSADSEMFDCQGLGVAGVKGRMHPTRHQSMKKTLARKRNCKRVSGRGYFDVEGL